MSIQDSVARLIDAEHIDAMRNMRLPSPNRLARTLADAGLLAPELPEPMTERGYPMWIIPGEGGDYDASVHLVGTQVILKIEDGSKWGIGSTPEESRMMGTALLAAAKHAQEGK